MAEEGKRRTEGRAWRQK